MTNFQHTMIEGDDLLVEDLVEDASTLTEEELAQITAIVLAEPSMVTRLISASGKYAAVHVSFYFDVENEQQQESVSGTAILALAKEIELKYPAQEVYCSGTTISNVVNTQVAVEDTSKLIPLMYLVMFSMLALLLRSLLSMLAIWVVTISSAIGAVGLGAWFDITFNTMTLTSVSIIITVSVAHCVHILVHFLNSYSHKVRIKSSQCRKVLESI
ncbi:MAG: MMPL family transporter [Pseudomonadales bacterium]|nr:MMPL family transporter [Pseudomonadales bacterium]